jgi:hypothetical protein
MAASKSQWRCKLALTVHDRRLLAMSRQAKSRQY